MGRAETGRHTGRREAAGLLEVVQRPRVHAVRTGCLERLVVTRIARGKVACTTAKRKSSRGSIDSSCSAHRVCNLLLQHNHTIK